MSFWDALSKLSLLQQVVVGASSVADVVVSAVTVKKIVFKPTPVNKPPHLGPNGTGSTRSGQQLILPKIN